MRAGWESSSLGGVCELIARGVAPKYVEDGGILVLNQKCVRDHRINADLARRHDDSQRAVRTDRVLKLGDVLVNSTGTGTLGRVAQVRAEPVESTTVDTHVTIVRPLAEKFHIDFFGYMMIQIEDELAAGGEGASGQTELARSTLADKFEVSYPKSIEQQQRIVAVLDRAFAGIATATVNAQKCLNNARELSTSCPTGIAKAERVTIGELLARGWLLDHMDGNHGGDYPRKDEFVAEGVIYLSANSIRDGEVDFDRAKFLAPARAAKLRKGFARNRDVLFAHNATVGPVALLQTQADFVVLGTSLTYYRCDESHIKPEYLANYLASSAFRVQYEAVMGQSTRNQVPITKQRELYVDVLTIDEQERIVDTLVGFQGSGRQLVKRYKAKLKALNELKQSLLQKAFAGELT